MAKKSNRKKADGKLLFESRTQQLVEVERITPDGKTRPWTILRFGETAAAIPLTKEGNIIVVKQYRAGADTWVYEIPGGIIEKGELPEDAVRRELLEEVGYKADKLRELITFYAMPGRSDHVVHLFIAEGKRVRPQSLEEDEFISIEEHSPDRLLEMARDGDIVDLKTLMAVLYYSAFKKEILGK